MSRDVLSVACRVVVVGYGAQRVILKYLEAEGKDPASGEEITAEDLVPVKSSKGPWVRHGGKRRHRGS